MATTKNWRAVAEKAERARIRAQLKLRFSKEAGWQVYTILHGTDIFRWFNITRDEAEWYSRSFPEIVIENLNITKEQENQS